MMLEAAIQSPAPPPEFIHDLARSGLRVRQWNHGHDGGMSAGSAKPSTQIRYLSGLSDGFGLFGTATGKGEVQISADIEDDLIGVALALGWTQRRYNVSGEELAERSGCDLLALPRGGTLEIATNDCGMRSVTLLGRRSTFAALLSGPSVDMLNGIEEGHSLAFAGSTIPLSIRNVAEDILTTAPHPSIAPLFLRAKTAELVWQIAHHLHVMAQQPTGERPVSERSRRALEDVRQRLEEHPERPTTIEQLGRTVGMNRTKLRALFKRVYGTTISDYRTSIVMKRADEMLRATDFSVAEIGYRLGYSEPSSFNMAYKRNFGHSPGQTRRHA